MTRFGPIVAAAVTVAALAASGAGASASSDDQPPAAAAIAAFNEQMTEAGAASSGPPDTTPIDPDEYAAENPASECFGAFATALDAGGRVSGETARAHSDYFSLPGDTGADDVNASVLTVDDDSADLLRDFVEELGSGDVTACIEEAFAALIEAETAAAEEASGTTLADDLGTVTAESESDLGIGDVSAHLEIVTSLTYDGITYVSNLHLYAAAAGRSLAAITVRQSEEPATDFDAIAALEQLVDSL
jgi:hypothetical protein